MSRPWTGTPVCPSRVRKRQSWENSGLRKATWPMLGQLKSQGTREGEIREAKTQRPKRGRQRPRKRASSGESGKGGESHTGDGERTMEETVQKGPQRQTRERKRQRTREGKQRAVGVDPPHPSLPELWGCRGDCLQGSGPRGKGGAGLEGQPRPPPLF